VADRAPGRPGRGGAGAAAAEAGLAALLDAAGEALALLDAEGRVLRANAALARLVGPAVAPSSGQPAARLVAPADRPALAAHLRAAAGDSAPPAALTVGPADPTLPADTAWAVQARPVRGVAPPRLLLHLADRTAERRAAARAAAAARLETVGRLAGGIAHDFNNLLGAILGAAEAARQAGLPAAAAAEIAQIEDAAGRGARLVRQLLAFARQQPVQPRVIDLRTAVAEAAPLLRRVLGPRLALDLALEAAVAPVRIDPAQLDQVLLNLVANAGAATAPGGRVRIALSRAVVLPAEAQPGLPAGRYVVLSVADAGAGIPPDILARLFEPFFTTRPDQGGTGLGLATVQGIVGQAGGHIAVESTVGVGTCFRIHLPRAVAAPEVGPAGAGVAAPADGDARAAAASPEAAAPGGAAPADAAPVAAPPAGASPGDAGPGDAGAGDAAPGDAGLAGAVLLVEDEAALRRLGTLALARAGYRVVAAESAEAALHLLAGADPPAALVSDVAMPGMDGLALARRVRARWPALPVLLLSGYAESLLGADLAAERLGFLGKPFVPAALVAAVGLMVGAAGGAGPDVC
jgi:two-component system cell cycle sensor histidine kinase/response regulator CckA